MNRSSRNRVILVACLVAALAAGVLYKLYALQVREADAYAARALKQHNQIVVEEGKRGSILDRNGRKLALSIEYHSLYVYPGYVDDPAALADQLAPVTDLSSGAIRRKIRNRRRRTLLAGRLSGAQAEQVAHLPVYANQQGHPALELEKHSERSYPGGTLAAHVVGFAGAKQVGLEGVELSMNATLQGDPVTKYWVKDAKGPSFVQRMVRSEHPYEDVYLTIDSVLQHVVERELERVVRDHRAKAATAILMEPATGKILAMANRPTADLERFGRGPADSKRNRAACDQYDPGSTFKIITAAALLDQGLVRPSERFYCEEGRYKVRNRVYRDHKRFGTLSFREVLEHSSNIGTIKAASRLPGKRFMEYVKKFGFGKPTGLQFPGEIAGALPDLDIAPEVHKASLSIGYGISVTPMQMIQAVAAVANGGVLVPPSLVEGSMDPDGVWTPRKRKDPRTVLRPETADTLARILEGVVLRGTGKQARVSGYRIAGKTGTARRHLEGVGYGVDGKALYYTSFVGFGPVRDPKLILLVLVDSPRKGHPYGGEIAAPVFSRIMSEAFRYLRIPPDSESMVIVPPVHRPIRQASLGKRTGP